MTRSIDHVTFAGSDLEHLRDAFETAGFEPTYGGSHANGVTHMALVGFEDGSYVELIGKHDRDATAPWWDEQIDGDAGASAWAVPTDGSDAAAARLREAGFAVDGPTEYARERPDGKSVEWCLTVVGEGPQGGRYPMVVEDRTPLDRRTTVTESAEETGLDGLSTAVVATDEFETTVAGFEAFFETERSAITEPAGFGARVAHFRDAPVAVASPLDGTWLAERVTARGTLPCAYLLDAADLATVRGRFALDGTTDWNGDTVHWLDLDVHGRLGVREADATPR